MATVQAASFLHFVIVASLLASTHGAKPSRYSMPFNRTSFPKDFTFGSGTAAYQVRSRALRELHIVTNWFIPKSPKSEEDIKAAYRILDFLFGWWPSHFGYEDSNSYTLIVTKLCRFLNPLTYGDYPESMKSIVGHRLPKFTKEQSAMVKGSIDFLGVNYYTTNYATNNEAPNKVNFSYSGDSQTILSTSKGGHPISTPGMYDLMLSIRDKYKNPPIYITENGLADANNASLPVKEALKDGLRIRYLANHLQYLSKAIKEGVNVKGYYQWAFWDDFEWDAGYTVRFGLNYIDFKNNVKRYMKYSAYWFKMFLLH
ncbi:hypothetical protein SADUNF_Sadunf16G0121500 [Salix dunnii]|uniref:Uncharacterized protein n=1 Tax=Salix dunnii TaxID=1413687 RepID=A0A835J9B3_9ROSI|nr:hypothetical protein SADUNF_Sadunf16G0121500 [Salix dunnii]